MLRLLADENFNGDLFRALRLRQPDLNIVRVQDVGLAGASDADILAWAAEEDRIVLTHDRATFLDFAYERLLNDKSVSGVFVVNDRLALNQAISELLLLINCTEPHEWRDRIAYLPLR